MSNCLLYSPNEDLIACTKVSACECSTCERYEDCLADNDNVYYGD